jgi:polysaccharide pyruvyl transferase WcaK-like protein
MAGPEVNVVGWYNKRNAGDEAYKLAFPALFKNSFVFSDAPKPEHKSYVLGGGDILSPAFLKAMGKVQGKKSIASTAFPEKIDRKLIEQFGTVIVRDQKSLDNAINNGVEAILAPDFAFILKGNVERGKRIINKAFAEVNADQYERVVGIVVNSHLMASHDGYAYEQARFERFSYEMAMAIDSTNASFLFIPFGKAMPWDDRAGAGVVASRCKFHKKNVPMYKDLSVQDTLDIVSALDCLVSTRLHSTIFAISNSVPFLDITHNHKNTNLLNTLDLSSASLSYKCANAEDIKKQISDSLKKKDQLTTRLDEIAAQQRSLLKGIVANVDFI